MPYAFTVPEQNFFWGSRDGMWASVEALKRMPKATTLADVRFNLFTAAGESQAKVRAKLAAVEAALTGLRAAGLLWPAADIQELKVVFYSEGESRGVVYTHLLGAKPTVVLQLGTRSTQHVRVDVPSDEVAGGLCTAPPRVLADRVYDYYKSTLTVSGKEKGMLAQAYHELGHIFHQLLSPASYMMGGEVAMGRQQQDALITQISTAGKLVSQYASAKQGKVLNEFVAEVFSGLMMGVDWDAVDVKVLQAYQAMHGPTLPGGQPHRMSRMADFKRQKCACAGSENKIDLWT